MPFYCIFWYLQTPADLSDVLSVPSFTGLIKRLNQIWPDISLSKWSLDTPLQKDVVVVTWL